MRDVNPFLKASFSCFRRPSREVCWCWILTCTLIAAACTREPPDQPTLTLVGLGLDAGERLKNNVLPEFTRATGIHVDLVPAWGTSAEQLIQMSKLLKTTPNPPDVYVIDVIWPGHLGAEFLDLTPYANAEAHAHLQALLENDSLGGHSKPANEGQLKTGQ